MIVTIRKFAIISLALYWPVLVFLAHVRVPESVRRAQVSDKSLHFLAYLVLAFLLWFSIKPNTKVVWRKISVWLILFGLVLYGSVDEVVQSYVGRTFDVKDIAANFIGILFALMLLTFVSFRPAAFITAGIVIFAIANISKANLAQMFPVAYGTFHFLAYAVFTIFWLLNMSLLFEKKLSRLYWLMLAMGVPVIFLFIVKLVSALLGRGIGVQDIIVPIAAILSVTIMSGFINFYIERMDKPGK